MPSTLPPHELVLGWSWNGPRLSHPPLTTHRESLLYHPGVCDMCCLGVWLHKVAEVPAGVLNGVNYPHELYYRLEDNSLARELIQALDNGVRAGADTSIYNPLWHIIATLNDSTELTPEEKVGKLAPLFLDSFNCTLSYNPEVE